jgi:chemotaxis signal transduction protein
MKTDVVPIRLNSNWLLVRAQIVTEFLSSLTWLSVPGSSPFFPGVIAWRGRAIPVLDLHRALNLGSLSPTMECARVMVVHHAVGAVAIPIDAAREVKTLSDDDIRPLHVSSTPYAAGEVDVQDSVIPLIDIEQLLREMGKAGG